eukprot:11180141-Lingulodinium_polyedra.AAC.1
MGSRSLRIGGATALYHSTKDLEVVKRYGRWASTAFHGYLWEDRKRQRSFAAAMADDFGELMAAPTMAQAAREPRRLAPSEAGSGV